MTSAGILNRFSTRPRGSEGGSKTGSLALPCHHLSVSTGSRLAPRASRQLAGSLICDQSFPSRRSLTVVLWSVGRVERERVFGADPLLDFQIEHDTRNGYIPRKLTPRCPTSAPRTLSVSHGKPMLSSTWRLKLRTALPELFRKPTRGLGPLSWKSRPR
jgi:hypothetical protein